MRSLPAIAAVLCLAGCAGFMPGSQSGSDAAGRSAVAKLEPTKGNNVTGTVRFTQKGDKVLVDAKVAGLAPGPHGFHIHEKGDCSSGDGMSAGGHFNPMGKAHASASTPERHAGDLPPLEADASGNASVNAELDVIKVGSGDTDVIGKAVIVHVAPDDFKTQPTGNSGARVACGVIAKA
jgi:Cu-Zn family superoxide dismutase